MTLQQLKKEVESLENDHNLAGDLKAKLEALESHITDSKTKSNKAMAEFNTEQELLSSRVDALEKVVGTLATPADQGWFSNELSLE